VEFVRLSDVREGHYLVRNPLPLAAVCSFLLHASPLGLAFAAALLYQHLVPLELRRQMKPPDEVVTLSTPMRFDRQSAALLEARLRSLQHGKPVPFGPPANGDASSGAGSSERFSLDGKHAKLKAGEGIYRPLRTWVENGVRYYQVAYEFLYPDGATESGIVPWPVHFAPGENPFVDGTPDARPKTPLPPPPDDYMPPGTLGKALRVYFPRLQFEDEG
jgi:hypothetical protein